MQRRRGRQRRRVGQEGLAGSGGDGEEAAEGRKSGRRRAAAADVADATERGRASSEKRGKSCSSFALSVVNFLKALTALNTRVILRSW